MKYAALTAMVFVMALGGTALWAQCPTATPVCPAPVQVQVPVCPAPVQTCPAPVATCPAPVATCPAPAQPCPCPVACPAIPAAVGAGPAGSLECLNCPDFDPAYARGVYQQYGTIIGLTEYGMNRAQDKNLRDISREIHGTLLSASGKIAATNQTMCGATCLTADMTQAQTIIAGLACPPECFDVTYAKTLSALIRQANAADSLAAERAVDPLFKQQAQYMTGKEDNWAFRLDRWVSEHGGA